MQSASRQCAMFAAPAVWAAARSVPLGLAIAAAGLLTAAASGQCVTTCPPGAVVAEDGCEDADDLVNGGCNLDTASFDELGALAPATPRIYCGQVGTFGGNTRDLDWARFTLSQAGTVTVSVTHKDLATGNPAPNITVFVLNGEDCATNQVVIGAVSASCPFVNSVILPPGAHLVVVTVNAFAPDEPACPVDFVATLTVDFGQFAECGNPRSGACAEQHATGGCNDFECCEQVCGFNPGCCEDGWDQDCVTLALKFCDIFIYACDDIGGPANDCVADATAVTVPSIVAFNSAGANTDGPPQPQCNSAKGDEAIHKDLWYYWTATSDGVLTASTCFIAPFDTKIAAYDLGAELPSTIDPQTLPDLFIACNEDCDADPAFASELGFSVVTGNTYLIRVGGYLGAGGPGEIEFTFAGILNDGCGGATLIGDGAIAFSTAGATTSEPPLPKLCDEGFGLAFVNDIWFRYVATCTGEVTVSTCGTASYDTRLAAYDGRCPVDSQGNLLACNDDFEGCAGFSSQLAFDAVCGNEYIIRVGGFAVSGTGTLTVSCAGKCPNACPTDLNGDGQTDGADLGILLGGWGGAGIADISGNGLVDGEDLGLILGAWGPCV